MAKELFLINRGDALVPASEAAEEGLRAYPLGAQLRVKITQKRSLPHHNFYWAFMTEAQVSWPDDHGFQPRDEKHLHAFAAVRCNFHEMMEWEVPSRELANAIVAVAKAIVTKLAGGRPVWWKYAGKMLYAAWPRSIAFDKMDEDDFKDFTRIIFTWIYSETGIDVEEYYERWQEKNGKLNVKPERERSKAESGLYFS